MDNQPGDKKVGGENGRTTIVFKTTGNFEGLIKALTVFQGFDIKLRHIESRTTQKGEGDLDFFVECGGVNGSAKSIVKELNEKECLAKELGSSLVKEPEEVAWFPRSIYDLDRFSHRIQTFDELLDVETGVKDPAYIQRKKGIMDNAFNHKHGMEIPRVEYSEHEINIWRSIFNSITHLYPTHACKEHVAAFNMLVEKCGYGENTIPQLEDVSDFLKASSGFQLRPVAGLLSSRDFLAGLAFRVFHCTQYVRHISRLNFSEEPDICHEMLGHVPLFADPEFAAFSQEIGLASLGAPDEYVQKLATLYWFTIEVGLCRQSDGVRVYGAAILSSRGELENALSDNVNQKPFDPAVAIETGYDVASYQTTYFVAESFKDATEKIREFAAKSPRPFTLRYNGHTQSVDVLENKEKLAQYAADIKADIARLEDAISQYGTPLTILED